MTAAAATPSVAAGIVLEAAGISCSFANAHSRFTLLLDRLALTQGDRVAVTGPSGCGKSTLLGLLALALRPDPASHEGGRLRLGGENVLALWRRGAGDRLAELRGQEIGFVPQTAGLLPFLSLRENILLCQRICGRMAPRFAADLADWLGIGDLLDRLPSQVSVGQRQRAAVARALAHQPRLVFADEPTASVHPAQAEEIFALLVHVAHHLGITLMIATHDAARAEAAGFHIVPCRADARLPLTRFSYPEAEP